MGNRGKKAIKVRSQNPPPQTRQGAYTNTGFPADNKPGCGEMAIYIIPICMIEVGYVLYKMPVIFAFVKNFLVSL